MLPYSIKKKQRSFFLFWNKTKNKQNNQHLYENIEGLNNLSLTRLVTNVFDYSNSWTKKFYKIFCVSLMINIPIATFSHTTLYQFIRNSFNKID